MKCASGKENPVDYNDLVACHQCDLKTARKVAVVMCLKGEEYFFCSQLCQDEWEEKNPDKLW